MHRLPLQISLAGLLCSCVAWADGPALQCALPELSDYLQLAQAAEECGTLANALEAVATGCFEPLGAWTGDQAPRCAEAIAFCEAASVQVNRHLGIHRLDAQALEEMQRSFFDKKYAFADKSILAQPGQERSCRSRDKQRLLLDAKERRRLALKHVNTLGEVASYRSWLVATQIACVTADRDLELKKAKDSGEAAKRALGEARKKKAPEEREPLEKDAEAARQLKADAEKRAAQLGEQKKKLEAERFAREASRKSAEAKAAIERARVPPTTEAAVLEARLRGIGATAMPRTLNDGAKALTESVMGSFDEHENREATAQAMAQSAQESAQSVISVWEAIEEREKWAQSHPGWATFKLYSCPFVKARGNTWKQEAHSVLEALRNQAGGVVGKFHQEGALEREPQFRKVAIGSLKAFEAFAGRDRRAARQLATRGRPEDGARTIAQLEPDAAILRCEPGAVVTTGDHRFEVAGAVAVSIPKLAWSTGKEEMLFFETADGAKKAAGVKGSVVYPLGNPMLAYSDLAERGTKIFKAGDDGSLTAIGTIPGQTYSVFREGEYVYASNSKLTKAGFQMSVFRLNINSGLAQVFVKEADWASGWFGLVEWGDFVFLGARDSEGFATIWRMPKAGGTPTLVYESDWANIAGMTRVGDRLVWSEYYMDAQTAALLHKPWPPENDHRGRLMSMRLPDGAPFVLAERPPDQWFFTNCGKEVFFTEPDSKGMVQLTHVSVP